MADEPITLAQARKNLRMMPDDTTEWDSDISDMIVAAREAAENATGLILTARQVEQVVDSFGSYVELVAWPVRSIVSIGYANNGAPLALAADQVQVYNRRPMRVFTRSSALWPAADYGSIVFTVEAGYETPAAVPAAIKRAMLMMVTHWFENRSAVVTGMTAAAVEVPLGAKELLEPHRIERC